METRPSCGVRAHKDGEPANGSGKETTALKERVRVTEN